MTSAEADRVMAWMKSGGAFYEDENDIFESWTWNTEAGEFIYLKAWTVIGSTLDHQKYTEAEFHAVLERDFSFDYFTSRYHIPGGEEEEVKKKDGPSGEEQEAIDQMITAIYNDDQKLFDQLLSRVKNVDQLASTGYQKTPLTMACQNGRMEMVRALLKKGANPNLADGEGHNALYSACNSYDKNITDTMAEVVRQAGGDIPAHVAGEDGAIHFAAMYGALRAVQILVEGGISADLPGSYGRTPLMYAAADGRSSALVKWLVAQGVNVNAVNDGKDNAFGDMLTRDSPSVEVAEALLDAGLDMYFQNMYGTVLSLAASGGHKDIVQFLLKRGFDVNRPNKDKEPAIIGAMQRKHHDIVHMLFDAGARADSTGYGGWSLLEYATEQGDEELVKKVMARLKEEQASDVAAEIKKNTGKAKGKPAAAVKMPKASKMGEAMSKAAQADDTRMLELLLSGGAEVDARNDWGRETAMMKAAYYGKMNALRFLLEHGADVKATDSRENTALLHAAWSGHLEAVKLLHERGSDLNHVNYLNWNSLMQAVVERHYEVVEYLLNHGARTDFIDKEKGASVVRIAQVTGSKSIEALLVKHGAKPRAVKKRATGEPYFSILECDYCSYVPQGNDLGNQMSMEDFEGMETMHSIHEDPDRYTTTDTRILKCRLCGTWYQQDLSIDTEDSFVAGPSVDQHIQRFNHIRLGIALKEYDLTAELAEWKGRSEALGETMRKDLIRLGGEIPPKILPYYLENVADQYIIRKDWAGLHCDMLLHADARVSLEVAHDLILICGEHCYEGPWQWYRSYRHIVPAVKEITIPMLKENNSEFIRAIQHWQSVPESAERATKVLESADYYKVWDKKLTPALKTDAKAKTKAASKAKPEKKK